MENKKVETTVPRRHFSYLFFLILFNFTILHWFCHISKWICHRYTCVPHPEPSSLLLGFLSPQIFIYKFLFYFLIFGFKRLKYQTTWSILRNLNAGQEAIVRTGQGTTNWFQIRKGVCQGCILLPCLFNLYAEYIMWNARMDDSKLEWRLPWEISATADIQMIPL